jgi:predicted O-methyltransferase YrrM
MGWKKDDYRKIYHGKGHGVHSPFAFQLITKVIKEHCPYYCYSEIKKIRKEIATVIPPGVFRKEAIRSRDGELLFRLANYFKPEKMLLLGSSFGLAALYLTAYASGLHCIALETDRSYLSSFLPVIQKKAHNTVRFYVGDYRRLLPTAVDELGQLDFIFIDSYNEGETIDWILETCLPALHEKSVLAIGGIHQSAAFRESWKTLRVHPGISVTIESGFFGIAFFDLKLKKQNYISPF